MADNIKKILTGLEKGRGLYEEQLSGIDSEIIQVSGDPAGKAERAEANARDTEGDGAAAAGGYVEKESNELFLGDNLEYMRRLLERGYAGRFRLIYIDPPFFTRSSFNASVSVRDSGGTSRRIHHLAYDDKFDRNLEYYIENMSARLLMMRDLLTDDGLMWIHLDWHSSHYIKLVLDELMGEKNFVNEIIWCYKSGGSGKRHFARKHDTILVYSKTGNYFIKVPDEKSYNRDYKPYRFKGVKEYQDENGWYTLVNMKDVWNIDMVGRTSAERTGYATQKPLGLMRRIIEASTEEGDLAGDFFCGSGSLLEEAELLGRRWMGCDSEEMAASMARRRLKRAGAEFRFIRERGAGKGFFGLGSGDPVGAALELRNPDSSEAEFDAKQMGRADVRVISRDPLEDGRFLYKCRLEDLVPDIDTGSIQMKDRRYVEDALLSDRLQFADHVMVDTEYGGREGGFECRYLFEKDLDDMAFICSGDPAVIVVDVFGREYPAELHYGD